MGTDAGTVSDSSNELFALLQAALEPQYRLERELGRGGMAVVFEATDCTLDRRVAVKVVHPELAAHATISQRFLAEARMLARIRHPNIVTVHHAGRAGELPYYVMDEVVGESLRQRLNREGPLPIDVARAVTADLAAALDAAGRAGFVHRDVKPENVLLDAASGRALLADFGIARGSDGQSSVGTGEGIAVGTPTYMSPEQAAGEAVDPRSDLYALGVVAYEALAGQPPFSGPSRVVVSRHISDRPAPIERLRPDTPPPLADAVMRALEKQPEDRWQTGEEFRQALLADRPPRRRRRPSLLAVSVLAIVLAAALGLARLRSTAVPKGVDPRRSMLVLPFTNLRDDRALDWLRDGSVSMLGLNLSQWNDLAVVDHERVHDLLAHRGIKPGTAIGLDQARQLARDAGAWTVVIGEYSRAADSLHLVVRVYDVASGKRVEVARADGPVRDDVRPLFDMLAARLLDLSGAPSEIRTDLAQSTTASLEAFRAYLSGVELLNRWRLAEAQRELERAIALDSTFSLAYYKLALVLGWTVPRDTLGQYAMERAVRSMGKLPQRDQRMLRAYHALLTGDYSTTRALYSRLIAHDSTDRDAWYGLGEAWFHDEGLRDDAARYTGAYRAFRRALAIDPDFMLPYQHVHEMLRWASARHPSLVLLPGDSLAAQSRADSAEGGGLPPRARAAAMSRAQTAALAHAREWVAVQPDTRNAHQALVDAYIAVGNFAAAEAEIARFRRAVPSYPEMAFTEARVRFASGAAERAGIELRRAVDSLTAADFDSAGLSPTTVRTVESGANIFAYLGDLDYANRIIDLGGTLERRLLLATGRAPSAQVSNAYDWRMRSELYAAVGGPPGSLRRIWEAAAEVARTIPVEHRGEMLASAGSAAVGLLAAPVPDTLAFAELARWTDEAPFHEVQALRALSRGDTAAARRMLAQPSSYSIIPPYRVFVRPLRAQVFYQLGDYAAAVRSLEAFDPGDFSLSSFDMRWGLLPRARLIRARAYEHMRRPDDARGEYRQVLAQWKGADPALRTYLDQAGRGLLRLGEPSDRLSALGYQLSSGTIEPSGSSLSPTAAGGRSSP
jgi:serine/threonine-protein kinase